MARIVACWVLLMLLFGEELIMAKIGFTPGICAGAVLMGLIIVFGFMRIAQAPPLAAIFALGGLFWLTILLALGSLDSFTRTNFAVGDSLSSRSHHVPASRGVSP
ncbi:hypothetical protein [Komagataeibacter sp. FNDCR2]|uniref:hypothetical protein n=1 Tax=Komagataeibacter sp. FNDCR2 TaxID=2878682 RepID=UPI001E40A9D8|nr:hypothetical protein [Komagataeibacter sp. FNDCR2]MCE2576583.1 hypothetical protein [Komagataeibacter sp. FNDCR2]